MTSIIQTEYEACEKLKAQNNSYTSGSGCSVDFDRSLCWASARLGQQMTRDCPFKFCTSIPGCEDIKDKILDHELKKLDCCNHSRSYCIQKQYHFSPTTM
ncbi:hypothetical protein L5515_019145 [Caenorhabditis briggsae]|uniref:G-protein coupled receptors family 2 profile 1 domain-containing protein n=1 Tax=Caenorhabditis briggsae TaxID=6238 RepID=A0AAE9FHK4_CAEBR|nr:hypothetical protein L5515_019145 [Caenorhabditis briggsae]